MMMSSGLRLRAPLTRTVTRSLSFVHLDDHLRVAASQENEKRDPYKSLPPPRAELIKNIRGKQAYLIDMDGVIYYQQHELPGACDFIEWLKAEKKKFLFLTNSSEKSPSELRLKLLGYGCDVPEENFYTSALATAAFLKREKKNITLSPTAYVIGEPALTNAIYEAGYAMSDSKPSYVIVGEGGHYSYEQVATAVRCVQAGAKLIGTNCDVADRTPTGFQPACGAMITPISMTTGVTPYFMGKPNPLMMRLALRKLKAQAEDTVIIGDRMNTDILAGVESEIDTCLVLTGVTAPDRFHEFAYQPRYVVRGLLDIVPEGHASDGVKEGNGKEPEWNGGVGVPGRQKY